MKKILYIIVLLIGVKIHSAQAQTFTLLGSGCNNKVAALASDGSGNLYAGGSFDHSGGNTVNYVSKWTGSSWTAMDNGMPAQVRALTIFNNELYAGGDFIYAGSASTVVWMVTKWNGSTWEAVGNGVRGVGVYALAVYNSELYAGGFFDTVFNPGKAIVKWSGSAWVALGGVPNNGVFGAAGYKVTAMKAFGGKLYVGGTFTSAGGVPANNIAKWDGTAWTTVGTGTNGAVKAFAVYNSELYVAGDFTAADGVTVNHIAKINGNTFSALGSGINGEVNALAVYQNNLFATGNFTLSSGAGTLNISRWDGAWHYLSGTGLNGIDGPGHSLLPYNGNLYIGGLFAVAGTQIQANSIVQWNMPPTGMEAVEGTTEGFNVFPNPSSGKFQLQLTGSLPEKFDLYVSDVSGRVVYFQKFNAADLNIQQIEIAGIKSGMYFLRLINQRSTLSTKLVIE